MGRKKIIDDDHLIKFTNQYIASECKYNPRYFRFKSLADYICAQGYPSVTARLLQRNLAVRSCIEEWNESIEDKNKGIVVAYKTLDVDAFIVRNGNPNALRKALSELDTYYKSVCSAATEILAENRVLKRKISDFQISTTQHKETVTEISSEIKNIKNEINRLKKENRALRDVVETYVYPEIANEILKKKGLLQNTSEIVSTDALESAMITADTDISASCKPTEDNPQKTKTKSGSTVISGMFSKY